MGRLFGALALSLLAAWPPFAAAQDLPRSAPVALPALPAVPDPVDLPYPGGAMVLEVDASDTQRGVFGVVQTIPLAAGARRITLLFPEWIPGHHAPRGQPAELNALKFFADGRPAAWRRDPVEVHAYHVDLPPGARSLAARFAVTTPVQTSEGRIVMTGEMLNVQWEKLSLYPAGHFVRRIRVRPGLTLPPGWTAATVLDGQITGGNRVSWAETDYETLIDSPLFAGVHFRRWELAAGISLDVVADSPEFLDARPEQLAAHRAMIAEALQTFGSRPFDRYHFLLALTDRMGNIGREHHRSSENQLEPDAFTQWARNEWDRSLLPHELAHSWIGKFRRPAGMSTPDYRQPMRDNLLWVYEGQTQFWGLVHAARAGLQSKDMVLAQIASNAGLYTQQPGRDWRSVEDTAHDPVFAARRPKPYPSLARNEDYYNEGALVWLEADQIIRSGTAGRKGLDDFARAFFNGRDGDWGVKTYEFADVVAALNAVLPYDWSAFLKTRIELPGQPAPLAGIERGGYRLVWKAEPNLYDKARMEHLKNLNLYHSLGLSIDKDGSVSSVRWGSAAFDAGIISGAKIVAVGGVSYDPERLKGAITLAKLGNKPIELLVRRGDRFQTVPVPWSGGLRWPWLERQGSAPSGLDLLLAPRRPVAAN